MSQPSICQVGKHSLVHVVPWIMCTGCMLNDHMVTLCECMYVHCLGSILVKPIIVHILLMCA